MQLQPPGSRNRDEGQDETHLCVPRLGASNSALASSTSSLFPSSGSVLNLQGDLGTLPLPNGVRSLGDGSSGSIPNSDSSDQDTRSSHRLPTWDEEVTDGYGYTRTSFSFAKATLQNSPRLCKVMKHHRFRLLRLLAMTSPWIIFTLLCADYGRKTMTKISAGISAFVVLWFVSLTKAPRKEFDGVHLLEDLLYFGDQASRAKDTDFRELLASATDAELEALCILAELSRPWAPAQESTKLEPERIDSGNGKMSHGSRSIFSRKSGSMDTAGSVNTDYKKSWSNLSENSRKVKFGLTAGHGGAKEAGDRPRSILKNRTDESLNTTLYHSASDLSVSSCSDFNRRNENRLKDGMGTQLSLELDLPTILAEFKPDGPEQAHSVHSNRHLLRLPGGGGSLLGSGSLLGLESMRSIQSDSNESAMTYHSACDAVLGDGVKANGELVSAEIAGLGQANGMTRVRIEFRSQCLRTQNEWQKSLLQQQKTLLKAVSQNLKKTQEELNNVKNWAEDMHEEQKVLLRGFRKIIPRGLDELDDDGEIKERVVVIAIDEDESIRASAQKLCQDLEYRCYAFNEVQEALAVVQRLFSPSVPSPGSLEPHRRKSGRTSVISLGMPAQMANWNALPLILLGASALNKLPSEWQDDRFFIALTSQAEDFEDVGRQLLAAGESELRERLRSRGISEYLFHPLSMNALRGTVQEMLRKKLGDEFLLVDTLGRGAFGVVYRAKRLRDGEVFALKEISLRRQAKASKQEANIELNMLKALTWPTVVNLIDEWRSRKDMVQYILMPVLGGGNLMQQIEAAVASNSMISPDRWLEWYAQTLHSMSYLHWNGVLHRDIKPANIFLAADCRALQVGDLGSAARLPGTGPHPARDNSVPGVVTTVAYSGPEVFVRNVFYASSDLWSLGVSFFQALTLKLPHALPDGADQSPDLVDPHALGMEAHKVLQEKDVTSSPEEKFANELMQLLRPDPMERPSAVTLAAQPHIKHCLETVLAMPEHPARQKFTTLEKHIAVFDRLLLESRIADVNYHSLSRKDSEMTKI